MAAAQRAGCRRASIGVAFVVQHWSPMSQLQASPEPGIWYVFDHSKRIAIIRHVEIRGRRLFRSVSFDPDTERRILTGSFPDAAMRRAGECKTGRAACRDREVRYV